MPGNFNPAQIDYSWLGDVGDSVAGGLSKRWQNQAVDSAIGSAKNPDGTFDFEKAVMNLNRIGATKEASVLSTYALAKSQQDATNAYRADDLALRRAALDQQPDAVRTAQAFAENPSLATANPSAANIKAGRDQVAMMKGKENLSKLLGRLTDTINELDESEGIANPDKGVFHNLKSYVQSSEYGQRAGAALATENQSKRKQMLNMRTVVSNLVRQASGMSAKAFDSNYELQTYLNSIADPQVDKYANLVAIDVLDQSFGLGGLLDGKLPQDVLQKVRAGSGEAIKQHPIQVNDTDMENPEVQTQSGGAPEVAPAMMQGEYDVQSQPLTGPQGAPMNRPLAPGMVVGGFRFKGGNPNDPNAWEPAQ
jgi:hypothetical protein